MFPLTLRFRNRAAARWKVMMRLQCGHTRQQLNRTELLDLDAEIAIESTPIEVSTIEIAAILRRQGLSPSKTSFSMLLCVRPSQPGRSRVPQPLACGFPPSPRRGFPCAPPRRRRARGCATMPLSNSWPAFYGLAPLDVSSLLRGAACARAQARAPAKVGCSNGADFTDGARIHRARDVCRADGRRKRVGAQDCSPRYPMISPPTPTPPPPPTPPPSFHRI